MDLLSFLCILLVSHLFVPLPVIVILSQEWWSILVNGSFASLKKTPVNNISLQSSYIEGLDGSEENP
jgi:hypothetical protein